MTDPLWFGKLQTRAAPLGADDPVVLTADD